MTNPSPAATLGSVRLNPADALQTPSIKTGGCELSSQ
jgi:hypothetical protein